MYHQQGDVLFHHQPLPKGAVLEKEFDGVVQHGEATGHAHRLSGDGFQLFVEPKTKERHLRLVKPTKLFHEEHKEIELPAGDYRIGIVREYDHFAEEARQVVD